ncbi:hypothetical protein OQA88_5666 [Cercophora sp. LCS_1]
MEFAAAIISITEVTLRTGSKLWKLSVAWRDAPEDLSRLRDDITRTEQFLDEIRQNALYPPATNSWKDDSPSETELKRLIGEGVRVLETIEEVVDHLVGSEKSDTIGKLRRLIWMANARKVTVLRKQLSGVVSSICQMLIAQNVSVSAKIYTSLKQSQTELEGVIGTRLLDASDRVTSQLEKTVQLSQHKMVLHLDHRLEAIEKTLVTHVRQSTPNMLSPPPAYQPRTEPDDTHPEAAWASFMHRIVPFRQSLSSAIPCRCRCHAATRYRWAMRSLSSTLGTVTLSYSGRSSTANCPQAECQTHVHRQHDFRNIHIAYHFPTWLVRIAMSILVSSNLNGAPQLNVRIYNHIPSGQAGGNTIFHAIRQGETSRVKQMLMEGRASVFDLIGVDTGHTALWVAMVLRRRDIVRVLLQAGADPYYELATYYNMSPIQIAFERSLTGHAEEQEIANLFPLSGYSYEKDYSTLQMAIMGELQLDLGEVLRQPRYLAEVNRRSADGQAPILTAALKGNSHAVRLLLRAGADVNTRSAEGLTALHYSCRSAHSDVVQLLLKAGASVHDQDHYGRDALFLATSCITNEANMLRLLSLLFEHGADANAGDEYGASILAYAVARGVLVAARFLLEHGAYVDYHEEGGIPTLYTAIGNKRRDLVVLLLEYGASIREVTGNGWNVLHFLGRYADVEMLRLFKGRLGGVSTIAKDVDGKTPLILLNERHPESELSQAFDQLLTSVEDGDDAESLTEDEFVDALEGWEVDGDWSEKEK